MRSPVADAPGSPFCYLTLDHAKQADLDALLSLAGIEGYDSEAKTFSVGDDDDPERFLYGWLEE